jgi:DNA-binding transcriptional regulator YiaG
MTPEEIKDLRKKAGLTQEEFAEEIGVSTMSVNCWEKGKRQPSPLALQKLRLFSWETKVRMRAKKARS